MFLNEQINVYTMILFCKIIDKVLFWTKTMQTDTGLQVRPCTHGKYKITINLKHWASLPVKLPRLWYTCNEADWFHTTSHKSLLVTSVQYWVNLFRTIKMVCLMAVWLWNEEVIKSGTVGALAFLAQSKETDHWSSLITRQMPRITLLALALDVRDLVS